MTELKNPVRYEKQVSKLIFGQWNRAWDEWEAYHTQEVKALDKQIIDLKAEVVSYQFGHGFKDDKIKALEDENQHLKMDCDGMKDNMEWLDKKNKALEDEIAELKEALSQEIMKESIPSQQSLSAEDFEQCHCVGMDENCSDCKGNGIVRRESK